MATQLLQIDSSSTRGELEEAFMEASFYRFPADVIKAQNYINLGTAILSLPLAEVEHGGERVRVEPRLIQEGIAAAERWLGVQAIATAKPVTYGIPCDWRGY